MRLRYFVVDANGQLRKARQTVVEGLWSGHRDAGALQCSVGTELRVITAICDDGLNPKAFYLLRLELEDGMVTESSRKTALEAVLYQAEGFDTPAIPHQVTGWPEDWQRQLAVALDTPATEICNVGIGGPLVLARLLGVTVRGVLPYFERAIDERLRFYRRERGQAAPPRPSLIADYRRVGTATLLQWLLSPGSRSSRARNSASRSPMPISQIRAAETLLLRLPGTAVPHSGKL